MQCQEFLGSQAEKNSYKKCLSTEIINNSKYDVGGGGCLLVINPEIKLAKQV